MTPRIGSLFAGYGGLDMGVSSVLGGNLAWYAEFDKHPAAIMARHHPDTPNLWDVTTVNWADLEPVDILTGGSPCQDLSHAGKRAGMTEGTRSNLWVAMREAIAVLRPSLVVWENVRGAYSAPADSDMEQCTGCMGTGGGEPVLRALGRVLGDLADLGFDARWYGLRAADVGAPHGRFRVFLFATPTDTLRGGWDGRASLPVGRPLPRTAAAGSGEATGRGDLMLLPMPVSDNSRGLPSSGTDYASLANVAASLLPTPTVNSAKNTASPAQLARNSLALDCIEHLLPTPRATDGTKGGPNQRGSSGDLMLPSAVHLLPTPTSMDAKASGGSNPSNITLTDATSRGRTTWGDYAPAITRWETILGRPAPAPTETGPKGSPRLSPRFVEWMMGLPSGHVTDTGIPRNAQLKALGNGVVPQQAAAATRAFLADVGMAAA